MKLAAKEAKLFLGLVLLLLLALLAAPATPARAASEDVAMFYDSLAQYGNWVDYGNYGPVWYPTQGVTQNWRPYVDGRWTPTSDGWVFETSEPWGWATYHWGNWMPTTEYGWVWSPGSTWYPSTAAWRTNDDYVGWAPIPPPDYVPEPAYYPTGGYYPNMPLLDLISAPFWIFAQAANFLLGFGQPYEPIYSYYNTGYLAPYGYVPFLFTNTLFLDNYYYPGFYHRGFYCFGPSYPYVSRVTNINITNINNYVRTANFNHIRGGVPPNGVLDRHPYFRNAVPSSVWQNGRFQAQRVANPGTAVQHLANPGAMRPPGNVPRLTKEIPRGVMPAAQPTVRRGTAAVAAPRGAGPARGVEVAPRGATAPRGVAAPHEIETPVRAPSGKFTAPGREQRAPTHEMRAPARAPAGESRARVREQAPAARAPRESRTPYRQQVPSARAPREFRAPSRGAALPPSATHELTPQMNRQIRQFQARPAPTYHAPAPTYHAPAPSYHAPAPAPRMAPSAPAPRPSGPPPGGGGAAPGIGGGGHHR